MTKLSPKEPLRKAHRSNIEEIMGNQMFRATVKAGAQEEEA